MPPNDKIAKINHTNPLEQNLGSYGFVLTLATAELTPIANCTTNSGTNFLL